MSNLIKHIKFSYNWNKKLDCKSFTTIRLHNGRKYQKGNLYRVFLKDSTQWIDKGLHECKGLVTRRKTQINDWLAFLDTGYNAVKCQDIITKMYKNKNVEPDPLLDIILLVKVPDRKVSTKQDAEETELV